MYHTLATQNKASVSISIPSYEIHETLGEGGYGTVYKATQKATGQLVALKMLRPHLEGPLHTDNQLKSRFEREVRICAEINHPYIVKLLDKGSDANGVPYVVFEYVAGMTLKDLILEKGGLSATETKELMSQVLDALSCAHALGIVHRDLKPQNIIISQTGTKPHIKVLDFGIGAFAQESSLQHDITDLSGTGTPAYSAPEQLRAEIPTIKSDIYAWGLLLLECLTGKPAIKGATLADIYHQQLHTPHVHIPFFIHEHPLAQLLTRVLDKNPLTRIGNTNQIFEEFQKIDFNTLDLPKYVGEISPEAPTRYNDLSWLDAKKEKRMVTVLWIKMNLQRSENCKLDQDTFDEIQQDQLKICEYVASCFGGYIPNHMGNLVPIYYGYQQTSDNDARLAGRTALEIRHQVKKRSQALYKRYGISLDTRIAINSGYMLSRPSSTPQGMTTNIAFDMLALVPKDTVLLTETSQKLLEAHLEFEKFEPFQPYGTTKVQDTYMLVKERPSEAFSQLRASSALRKMHGRASELSQISHLWELTSTQSSQTVLLQGEAGIGKSKLIHEVKKKISAQTAFILETRCLPEHKNNSLFPILELIKKHHGLKESKTNLQKVKILESLLQELQCDIKKELPILCSWLSISVPETYQTTPLSPIEQRAILFGTLKKCLQNLSGLQKCLFIIEDFHWVDPTTEILLRDFTTTDFSHNILFILASREALSPHWLPLLTEHITLKPLDKTIAKHIVEDILETTSIHTHTLEYILRHCDGIPIFVEEFTNMLRATKELVLKNDTYSLNEGFLKVPVPVTLKELLHTRLDHLKLAKDTAQLAATLGREVSYELLSETTLKDGDQLQHDLDMLIQADLMYRQRAVNGDTYVFRHALFKEVAYESLPSALRQQTHARIAEFLTHKISLEPQYSASEAENLAHHLHHAQSTALAIDWILKTAEIAVKKSASQETVNLCRRALEWQETLPATAERDHQEFAIRQMLIPNLIAMETYGAASVGEQLNAIEVLLDKMSIQETMFPSMFWYSTYYMMRGDAPRARKTAQQVAEQAEKVGNTKWVIVASTFWGLQLFNNGCFEEASKVLERSLSLFNPKEHDALIFEFGTDQEVITYSILASAYAFLGRYEDMALVEAKAKQKLQENEHHYYYYYTKASLHLGLGCTHFYLGNKAAVLENSQALLKFNAEKQLQMHANYIAILNAWAQNDLNQALEAMALEEAAGMLSMRTFWYAVIAAIEIENGHFEAAKKRLHTSLSLAETSDAPLYISEIHRMLGEICAHAQAHAQAQKHFETSLQIAKEQNAHMVTQKVKPLLLEFRV